MSTKPENLYSKDFNGEIYKSAAEEHLHALDVQYRNGLYVLAIYTSGVAVECILKGYKMRLEPTFDSRHNLYKLWKESGFSAIIPHRHAERYGNTLTDIAIRWSNSHRYRSENALRTFLKRGKLDRGIKGDFVKENARRAVNAATDLVTIGILRWKN